MSTLIEKLEHLRDTLHKLSADFSHDTKLRLINEALGVCKAINIVKQHSDWISVDERMPNEGELVLAYKQRFELLEIAKYSGNVFWAFDTRTNKHNCNTMSNTTHWMPLPQPPSEVQP